jgi:hypothetical protein
MERRGGQVGDAYRSVFSTFSTALSLCLASGVFGPAHDTGRFGVCSLVARDASHDCAEILADQWRFSRLCEVVSVVVCGGRLTRRW